MYSKSQLQNQLGFYMTGNGPYWVPQAAIGADGRGAPQPGQALTGQLFTNPLPGQLGALQRRIFTGPSIFSMDAALSKNIRIDERRSAELRLEALNAFNHPVFSIFAQGINTTTFGKITSGGGGRQLQLDLRVRF